MSSPSIWIPRTEDEERRDFLRHATEESVVKFYIAQEQVRLGRQLMQSEVVKLFKNRGVCPKCERVAFRERDNPGSKKFQCTHCGHIGNFVALGKYIAEEMYR